MQQPPPYGQQPPPPGHPVQYSPDGRFWWDGQQWQPVPIAYYPPSGGGGATAAIVIAIVVGAMILLAVVVIVILTVVGKQVNNVFSNISSGLVIPTGTP